MKIIKQDEHDVDQRRHIDLAHGLIVEVLVMFTQRDGHGYLR